MSKGQGEKSRRGRSNRARGGAAEREVCQLINSLIPGVSAKRHLAQWRDKSQQDVVGVDGWLIQVKYCRVLSRPSWWAQVDAAAQERGWHAALFYRKPGDSWSVMVRARSGSPEPITITPSTWAELFAARPWW